MAGTPPVTVYFKESEEKQFGDEHLDLLASIPNLTRLNLSNTATTEHGLKRLKRLKNLESLILDAEKQEAFLKKLDTLLQQTLDGESAVYFADGVHESSPNCAIHRKRRLRVPESHLDPHVAGRCTQSSRQ